MHFFFVYVNLSLFSVNIYIEYLWAWSGDELFQRKIIAWIKIYYSDHCLSNYPEIKKTLMTVEIDVCFIRCHTGTNMELRMQSNELFLLWNQWASNTSALHWITAIKIYLQTMSVCFRWHELHFKFQHAFTSTGDKFGWQNSMHTNLISLHSYNFPQTFLFTHPSYLDGVSPIL